MSLTQGQLPIRRVSPRLALPSATARATPRLSQAMEVAGDPVLWAVEGRLAHLISSDPFSHHLLLAALLVLALQEPLANT